MLIECPACLGDQAYEETYGDSVFAVHPCQVCNGYGTVRQSDLKGLAAREASIFEGFLESDKYYQTIISDLEKEVYALREELHERTRKDSESSDSE